jgi:hypothetical protein
MATFYARMLDAETNGEGAYTFEGPEDLMKRTADEIVTTFFDYVEQDLLKTHADWEINGAMKNKERQIVTAIGSLIPEKSDPPMPFLLLISDRASA